MTYTFDIPWERPADELGQALAGRILAAISPADPLYGLPVEAIARTYASDDVLFRMGSQFLEIHMSYNPSGEYYPTEPYAKFFESFEQWLDHVRGEQRELEKRLQVE